MHSFFRKSAFLLVVLCLVSNLAFAQEKVEYVILKSGKVIEGEIIAHSENEYIRVKDSKGIVHWLSTDDVERVSEVKPEAAAFNPTNSKVNKKFYTHFNIGVLAGRNIGNSQISFSAQFLNGYRIKPKWGLGFGTGVEFFQGRTYFPFYGDLRWHHNESRTSPFLELKAGYALGTANEQNSFEPFSRTQHNGGIMFAGSAGFSSKSDNGNALEVSIGYRYQRLYSKTTYEYDNDPNNWWWWQQPPYPSGSVIETFQYLSRVSLRMGFTF